jgi:TonB family protein
MTRRRSLALLLLVAASLSSPRRALGQQPAPPPSAPAPQPVLVPPRLLSDPEVPYPEGGQGEGSVLLLLLIDPEGKVLEAGAIAGDEPFASKATEAARRWRFDPATRDGKPVRAKIRFQVIFRAPRPAEAPPAPSVSAPAGAASGEAPPDAPPPPPPKPRKVDEILVIGDKPEPSRSVSLTRAEVRQIPGTFGDPFRAIEVMPGVTPIVSGLPFFFIRGAPPGNAGYFLDGVRVPLLFHIGAGPSVIHPALMDRVDLYPGGYPARYGRFSGGIVAGETMPPVKEVHGEYNVRLFDAGAMVEVPFHGNRGTVLAGGRYSYTGALLTLLSPTVQLEYWDYQSRISYDLTPDDRVTLFAFGSYDFLAQQTPTGTIPVFGAQFHRLDLRYDHRLSADATMRLAVMGGVDRTLLREGRALRDRLLGIRSEFDYRLASWARLRAGTDAQFDTYDIELGPGDLGPSAARILDLFPTRSDVAMAGRADVVMAVAPGFEVTPGLRVDFFGSQGATALAFDPRLATRLELHQRARLLSAFGVAHQPPAFAIPVPGFQPGGLRGGLQRAIQESVGLEFDLDSSTTATATVFRNAFFNMSDPLGATQRPVTGCPPGSFPEGSVAGDRGGQNFQGGGGGSSATNVCGAVFFPPGVAGPDRSGGSDQGADSRGGQTASRALEVRTLGSAYGLEIFVKRRLTHRLGGFFAYTLSRSTRSVGDNKFVASFDRTHVANVALAYNLGRNWRAGSRVMFYTGLPRAPDPTTTETRLPSFFRLDLRLEKRWQLGKTAWISFIAEWMNATLNKESITTTCTLQGCEAQEIGPITIPSLGLEGGF